VSGAAVTTGVAGGRDVITGVAEGVTVAVAVAVAVAVVVAVAVTPGVVVEAAPEAEGRVSEGRDPEQAATDRDASTVTAQPAASLALRPVPAMVARIFMGLLRRAEDGGCVFPAPYRKGNRGPVRRIPGAPAAIKGKRADVAHAQWPFHHWNIRLRD
jgi:hypothetical protein